MNSSISTISTINPNKLTQNAHTTNKLNNLQTIQEIENYFQITLNTDNKKIAFCNLINFISVLGLNEVQLYIIDFYPLRYNDYGAYLQFIKNAFLLSGMCNDEESSDGAGKFFEMCKNKDATFIWGAKIDDLEIMSQKPESRL